MESRALTLVFLSAMLYVTHGAINCFNCQDLVVVKGGDAVKQLVKGHQDQACRDDDLNKMIKSSCSGECGKYAGTASGKDDKGEEFELRLRARTCEVQPTRKTNDCKDVSDTYLKAAQAIVKNIKSVDIQQCYCNTDKCNGQETLSPALTTCFISLAMALYSLC